MFGRKENNLLKEKVKKLETKINALSYRKTDDVKNEALWNDDIHPYMPRTIVKKQIDVKNADHRAAQIRYNIFAYKQSFGVAEKLLSKRPYPFSFAKPYTREGTTEDESKTESVPTDLRGGRKELASKSNSAGAENQLNGKGNAPFGSGGLFGQSPDQTEIPKIDYEIREDMNFLYENWRKDDMFYYLEQSVGIALGVNSSFICRTKDGRYWVFGSEQIEKVKGKRRQITKVKVKWSEIDSRYEEEAGGSLSESNPQKNVDDYFVIGKDCVMVQPFPWVYDIFGYCLLYPNWDQLISKQYLRFLHMLSIWKGNRIGEYNRYPDNLDDAFKRRIELNSKRGWLSEGVNIEYPAGMNPEFVDKAFVHEEFKGNDINWDEANGVFSQDSPFPKSFIEGNVESGALGGMAPKIDKQKEDEQLLSMFRIIDKIVKDINQTFYDFEDEEYIVIPWQDDKKLEQAATEDLQKEAKTTGLEKTIAENKAPPETNKKTNTLTMKKNAMTADGLTVYRGNLFAHEWYQDDGSVEYLDATEIKKYIDNPLSVKEGYMQVEHPEQADLVLLGDAIAKYKIIGFDEEKGTDITEFYINQQNAPEEIDVSSMYYAEDVDRGGKTYQTNIDLRNAVFTSRPRSKGATKATKI